MKLLHTSLAFVVAAASSTSAMALDHKRSEFTLGYENMSFFAADIDGPFLRAKTDFGFSPNFGMQLNAAYADMDFGPENFTRTTIGLHPYYEFTSGNRLGAFIQQSKLTIAGTDELTISYAGIEGIVNPLPNVSIEGYAGVGEVSENADFDLVTIGSQINYGFTENLAARFSADFDTISTGPISQTFSQYALGVDYYLGSVGSALPMILCEVGQINVSSLSLDRASVMITIPLGGGSDTSSRKLFRDRGALTQTIPFF